MISFDKYFVKFNEPVEEEIIQALESLIQSKLPEQYKLFLLRSNGADLRWGCLRSQNFLYGEVVTDFFDIEAVITNLNIWRTYENIECNTYLQDQHNLLPIAGTMCGHGVHIGTGVGNIGKVFIDRTVDIYEEEGKRIIPVYLAATSLIEFLELLEPFPEE